jgi:hypothetical protein
MMRRFSFALVFGLGIAAAVAGIALRGGGDRSTRSTADAPVDAGAGIPHGGAKGITAYGQTLSVAELVAAYAAPYPRCGFEATGDGNDKNGKFNTMNFTGQDSPTLELGGHMPVLAFDGGSERTLEKHDTVLLPLGGPADYSMTRIGTSLRICSARQRISLFFVRHYCRGAAPGAVLNNEIEEITFPKARVTWLADELYDRAVAGDPFPPLHRIASLYGVADETSLLKRPWTVRRFSDVLPDYDAPAPDCNLATEPAGESQAPPH